MTTVEKLLMIPVILVGGVGSYITYFIIGELPKKIGYPKFILVCIAYILFIALMLPVSYIKLVGPFISLAFIIFSPLLGVWYLRTEFVDGLKKLFSRNQE